MLDDDLFAFVESHPQTNCVCLLTNPAVQCGDGNKRSPITSLLTAGSDQTINEPEENLSAYFEPFGSALVPNSPGNRDSIASCESDSLLVPEKKDDEVRVCSYIEQFTVDRVSSP